MSDLYELVGKKWESCSTGARSLLELTNLLSSGRDAFSFEAYFKDLEAAKLIAKHHPSSRFLMYGWAKLKNLSFFDCPEAKQIENARLIFDDKLLELHAEDIDPQKNLTEFASVPMILNFGIRLQKPVSPDCREPRSDTSRWLEDLTRKVTNQQEEVRKASAMTDGYIEHHYMVRVPSPMASEVAKAIAEHLHLQDVLGSFELRGSIAEISNFTQSGVLQPENFPEGLWSYNSIGKTAYGIGRQSYLRPFPEVKDFELLAIAKQVDTLAERIRGVALSQHYLNWKPAKELPAQPKHGNFIRLSKQNGGYSLLVGFEESSDSVPSLKDLKSEVSRRLAGLDLKLKKVPFLK